MWMVFYMFDSPLEGWEVPTEQEAIEFCREHEGYRYSWIG